MNFGRLQASAVTLVWGAVLAGTVGSCVKSFDGSKIELYLHGGVQVPGDDPSGYGRPPSDTHFEIWVARDQSAFHVFDFDLRPVIDINDPCFIEEEGSRFQGLHSTKIIDKLTEAAMADGKVTDREAGDIASARIRVANMGALAATLKVITLHEAGLTNAKLRDALANIPTPDKTDDATNLARLAACKAVWSAHPGYYVGTDKTLAVPLAGTYYGMAEGVDPRNNAFLGGGQVDSDLSFPNFDALRINWNWNDPNDPRKASLPPTNDGYHYMAGTPVMQERGVINVTLVNHDFSQISGDVSIFTNLGQDDVHF
jgi:hypothetical protein